jgi:hypothetical protein
VVACFSDTRLRCHLCDCNLVLVCKCGAPICKSHQITDRMPPMLLRGFACCAHLMHMVHTHTDLQSGVVSVQLMHINTTSESDAILGSTTADIESISASSNNTGSIPTLGSGAGSNTTTAMAVLRVRDEPVAVVVVPQALSKSIDNGGAGGGAVIDITGAGLLLGDKYECHFTSRVSDGAVMRVLAEWRSPTEMRCITPAWGDTQPAESLLDFRVVVAQNNTQAYGVSLAFNAASSFHDFTFWEVSATIALLSALAVISNFLLICFL